MVAKVIKEIKDASYRVGIFKRSEITPLFHKWSLKVKEYFSNNTCLNITTMDNFGIKQIHKKVEMRSGEKLFRIIREYTIPHSTVMNFRDFVDSINDNDGPILNQLKQKFDNDQQYAVGGFAEVYQGDFLNGHSFSICLNYSEDFINKHKNIFCALTGTVISRYDSDHMAINPVYGKDIGLITDSVAHIEFNVKSYLVLCNKSHTTKENYFFTLGGNVHEACCIEMQDKDPGVYIYEQSKNLTTKQVESHLVKFINFSDLKNVDGVFTSRHEANIALNIERTQKEKQYLLEQQKFENDQLKNQNEQLKIQLERDNIHLKFIVQEKEKELVKVKQDFELFKNNIEKEFLLTKHNVDMESIKANEIIEIKRLHIKALEMHAKNIEHQNKMHAMQRQFELETYTSINKLNELKDKETIRILDHTLSVAESHNKLQLLENSKQLATIDFYNKQVMLQNNNALDKQQHERKLMEERAKTINSGASFLNVCSKVLGIL